ncbi:hypothetical protein HZ326_21936 [Fusarium oxysporum f. sp. albedinis]|nr:hypothetical protein HZ326_21936 [Fusarium oxysporum f. sp. albedinis]
MTRSGLVKRAGFTAFAQRDPIFNPVLYTALTDAPLVNNTGGSICKPNISGEAGHYCLRMSSTIVAFR